MRVPSSEENGAPRAEPGAVLDDARRPLSAAYLRRRGAPPGPSVVRAGAYAAGMSRRAFPAIVALAAIAVLLVGCSGAGATPITVYVTPSPAAATPVATPVPANPNLGKVAFGTHFNATTLLIDRGSMTFSRTASQVCWSAALSASPKHSTVREVIVRVGSGGVETGVTSQSDEVSNAAMNLWANCEPFEAEVGYVKGSYMLRFLDGVTVLAEGRFVLK